MDNVIQFPRPPEQPTHAEDQTPLLIIQVNTSPPFPFGALLSAALGFGLVFFILNL